MTKGDLIYCYTCGKISFDDSPAPIFVHPNTRPCKSRQDSRFNPNWNYRCAHCYGFKTVNATQFLETGQTTVKIPLKTGINRETLKAFGRMLKESGIIKEFRVQPIRNKRYRLYEKRRVKREILKAIAKWGEKENFK